jgi:hypothetical protein
LRSADLEVVTAALEAKKKELNLHGEIKWDKVTSNYLDKYIALMDCFMDFVRRGQIKIRIMFTQNIHVPKGLTAEQVEERYFILYYQFLKHGFGFIYAQDDGVPIRLRLLLDQLPDTREKIAKFKARLLALPKNPQFRDARVFFIEDDISDVCSHEHDVLQCLDVLLGSMQFKLNNKHKYIEPGKHRRGKRTIAKEKLYKYLHAIIQSIYPRFNIGMSTGIRDDIANRWNDPYRHWRFIPSQFELDSSRGKKKNK